MILQPLARLGADVLAVDASERNVATASAHARQGFGLDKLRYVAGTAGVWQIATWILIAASADDLNPGAFDLVCSFEVIEHVSDPPQFVQSLSRLAKEGGTVCMSTINRTAASYMVAVVAAEQLLQWVSFHIQRFH